MSKYRIFSQSKKIVLTNNLILYSSLGIGIFLYVLQKYVFGYFLIPEEILGFIFLSIWLIGIVFVVFFSWHSYEPLKGTLDSFLELYEDCIVIENDKYFLDEIKSIEIFNFDFKGDHNYAGKGNYNGTLSNGIGNLLKINLLAGKSVEVNFQQDKDNEIASSKKELVTYYKNGKISLINLSKIFGYNESDHEIIESIIKYHS